MPEVQRTAEVTAWPSLTARSGEAIRTTWGEFFDELDRDGSLTFRGDRSHGGWSPARFIPCERANAHVQAITAIVLDYDGTHELTEALETWAWAWGYVHTTRKHQDHAHRFRVILPLSREVTRDEHALIWQHLVRVSGHHVDRGCKDPARFWFRPGPLAGHSFWSERLTGHVLDAGRALEAERAFEAEPPVPRVHRLRTSGDARLERYVSAAVQAECDGVAAAGQGGRNNRLNEAAFALGQFVGAGQLSEQAAIDALVEASRACGLPLFESRRTILSGLRAGQRNPRQLPQDLSSPVPAAQLGRSWGANMLEQRERLEGLERARPEPMRVTVDAEPEPPAEPSPFEWRGVASIFEPLPPVPWVSAELQLCPGRPAILAGYGSSAKTLSAQALALAVASGSLAWGHFPTAKMRVRHLDYEQGWRATARRYQRLAIGHNIAPEDLEDRLEVAVFPRVYLDSSDAVDAYARACENTGLVVLDALRGAAPTQDENDSAIRACIDNLSRVSERTGTLFLVLHHAGKPKDGHADKRTVLRGSSAIFDAAGCVLVATAGKTPNDPRRIEQVKPPAEAEGQAIEPFELVVEDVYAGGSATGGVKVAWRAVDPEPEVEDVRAGSFELDRRRLLEAIRKAPGISQVRLVEAAAMGRSRALAVLSVLAQEGDVRIAEGNRGAKLFFADSTRGGE